MSDTTIENILNAKDLFELADRIEGFIISVEKVERDKNQILRSFYDQLTIKCFEIDFYANMPYKVFSGNNGINLYLKDKWRHFASSYRKNIGRLQTIANDIRSKMTNPQGPRISGDDVAFIMETVDQNLNFSKILNQSYFEVILLDHSHIEWNSFLSARASPNGKQGYRIMATHVREDSCDSPQCVLLHELGHVLHMRLTRSLDTPPSGFIKLQQKIFSKGGELSNYLLSELFADCFAIAAAFGSPLEKYDPYVMMLDVDKGIITAYIISLIQSIDIA